MRRVLLVTLVLALGVTTALAAEFSSLEERMSAAEFRAAGLDKLSEPELASLNEWLRVRGTSQGQTLGDSRAGFRDNTFFGTGESSSTIEAVVRGEFRGWARGQVLTLENGQQWEVTDGSLVAQPTAGMRVTIEPAFMGSWLMKADGYNASARVKRLR